MLMGSPVETVGHCHNGLIIKNSKCFYKSEVTRFRNPKISLYFVIFVTLHTSMSIESIEAMEYNTTRNHLAMREYGRHIQKMIEYLLTLEDAETRQRNAYAVIE